MWSPFVRVPTTPVGYRQRAPMLGSGSDECFERASSPVPAAPPPLILKRSLRAAADDATGAIPDRTEPSLKGASMARSITQLPDSVLSPEPIHRILLGYCG